MLIEFTCKNYKTFKTKAVLSLVPTDEESLSYSLIKQNVGDEIHLGLSSLVIYGANAAGKSNIISAMETLQHIILHGLRNFDYKTPSRAPLLFSHFKSKEEIPVELGITFITEEMFIKYLIAFRESGDPSLEYLTSCDIYSEKLIINSETIFSRDVKKGSLVINSNSKILKRFSPNIKELTKESYAVLKSNLAIKDLFLTNGFKNYICLELVEIIQNWFTNQFILIYNLPRKQLYPRGNYEGETVVSLPTLVSNAVSIIGGDNKIGYKKVASDSIPIKVSTITKNRRSFFISSELVESLGTLRFLDIFPIVLSAFQQGSTLIVDELDASIHPQVIASLIGAFHNDNINKNGAQLIFNTQNPVFLNKALFRKDEIRFVEKNKKTLNSDLYSLADFNNERFTTNDIMLNYLKERYGAIPEIDFNDVLLKAASEESNK